MNEVSEDEGKDISADEESNKELDDASDEDADLMSDEPFIGLDLRSARCFGYSSPLKDCWTVLAAQADDIGWENIDVKQLEKDFTKNVEQSYMDIASFKLVNIDDDVEYSLAFDNNKSLWKLSIANSPKAELDIQERADFFKSQMFKKIAKQTYSRLVEAKDIFSKIVKNHLDNAELLLVDVVKLDAIMQFIDTEHFMQNVLNGKYLSY